MSEPSQPPTRTLRQDAALVAAARAYIRVHYPIGHPGKYVGAVLADEYDAAVDRIVAAMPALLGDVDRLAEAKQLFEDQAERTEQGYAERDAALEGLTKATVLHRELAASLAARDALVRAARRVPREVHPNHHGCWQGYDPGPCDCWCHGILEALAALDGRLAPTASPPPR